MIPRPPARVAEALLYAALAFGPFAFGCVEPWALSVLEVLVFLLALACVLRGPRPVPGQAAWFWLVPAGFAAFGLLQLMNPAAADLPRPLGPFTAAASATRAAALLWAAYAALLWSVPQVLSGHEAARRFARVLYVLGMVLAAQGLLQLATTPNRLYWVRHTVHPAAFGPYYNRDHAANFLLMAAAIGVGLVFSKRRKFPAVDGAPAEYVRSQGRLVTGVVLVAAGAAACASRGAFLAAALAGCATGFVGSGFVRRTNLRRECAAAAAAVAALLIFLAFWHVGASADAGSLTDPAITTRLFLYSDGWRMLRDVPLFGAGLGSFETVYPAYQDQGLVGSVAHAHSDWLELALETGLAGLLAALAASAAAYAASARLWLKAPSSEMRSLIGGALAAAAAFAVHALFDFPFQIPGNAVVFLAIVGFLLSAPQWADKGERAARAPAPAPWAAGGAVAAFAVLAWAAVFPPAESDPRLLRRAGAQLYAEAVSGGRADVPLLRSSLGLALAAAELRPFDHKALSLAGTVLFRLGREADGRELVERSRLVRFARVTAAPGAADAGRVESRLAELRALAGAKEPGPR